MSEKSGAAILYSRSSCPLCFALKRAAARAARRHGVPLTVVDIEKDAALASRYGSEVPVLHLPGGGVLQGRASPDEIESAFRSAARQTSSTSRRSWLHRLFEDGPSRDGASS